MNRDHKQSDLFGNLPPKKSRKVLSVEEKHKRQEQNDAHIAWKLLKGNKRDILTQNQKYLLKKYYGVSI